MDNEPWQRRAKLAGLNQKTLAKLLGVAENTVSLQLRGKWATGTPQYVKTVILAWERLSPEAREALLAAAEEPKT
jgi:predicted transcriptional regulator